MSQYQNQYGAQSGMTDEYGNPVKQVDQFGNPVSAGGFAGEARRQHLGTTAGVTGQGHRHGQQQRGVDQTTGYRTHTGGVGRYGTKAEYGSSNTGSGYGTGTGYGGSGSNGYVREEHQGDKKRVMDKIKDKIPGTEQSRTNTHGTGYRSTVQGYVREQLRVHHGDELRVDHGDELHGEKQGIMYKIKDKLPRTGACNGH
uniref:Dehydrin-3 n=1 Tax=Macrotyloma uniflorum TaxID=271171 RepID=M4QK12_MACUN|nr:dehydrin-3 [Macrotyloma uniflorum]